MIIQDVNNWNIYIWVFAKKHMMLACKTGDMTRSYISRSSVHWRFKGKKSCGATFCGGTNGAEGCKGEKRCCDGIITIHISASGSTTRHKGASDGGSTEKGDGDGATRIRNYSKEKTCNTKQTYTFGERH